MSVIWATRGLSWGFRFLRTGGHSDPLIEYERVFIDVPADDRFFKNYEGTVALRFPDPLARQDQSGRTIPHEFVLTGDDANGITSVEDGLALLWPRFSEYYAQVWAQRSVLKPVE